MRERDEREREMREREMRECVRRERERGERERAMMKRKISTFLANRSERARARESGGASLKTTSSVGAKRSYKSK